MLSALTRLRINDIYFLVVRKLSTLDFGLSLNRTGWWIEQSRFFLSPTTTSRSKVSLIYYFRVHLEGAERQNLEKYRHHTNHVSNQFFSKWMDARTPSLASATPSTSSSQQPRWTPPSIGFVKWPWCNHFQQIPILWARIEICKRESMAISSNAKQLLMASQNQ